MPQLICRDLSVGYNSKQIVSSLNFEINKGDYLCIVGENGSGKTTLMKTILGLYPPIQGSITTGDGLLSTKIGYLPQHTALQKDFPASVREIVLSGCQNKGKSHIFYSAEDKMRASKIMDKLGITDISRRCYRELSGGQQQRVLLARALCATGKLLLLDEPTAGLDPIVTSQMYSMLEKLNRDDNITIIMVSHDIASAIKYASHILHIGKTTFFGTTKEYLKSDFGYFFSENRGDA